jgi:PleD family two-component response regulator
VSYLLFADDNEDMRLVVRDLLESSGHEVALVADGIAALDAVRAREPDLLILDLAMPGMSGFEVCRAIKSNPFTARIPVLMLTAMGGIDSKVEGFEAGADDYLSKPFDPRELRARVAALVRLVRRESDRNPTSGLPGGRAIEDEIAMRAARGESYAVCYLDIDNFKPFADTFGFGTADTVIRETGMAIRESVAAVGTGNDFVGHIGGDDFLLVTTPAHAESIACEVSRRVRACIASVVGPEASDRGGFIGVDRDGRVREFPLARISAAVLIIPAGQVIALTRLGERAAELKRKAKQDGAATVVVEAI